MEKTLTCLRCGVELEECEVKAQCYEYAVESFNGRYPYLERKLAQEFLKCYKRYSEYSNEAPKDHYAFMHAKYCPKCGHVELFIDLNRTWPW